MRCGFHPLLARRKAPHNQRMQQSIPSANKFAAGLAPDPQRIMCIESINAIVFIPADME